VKPVRYLTAIWAVAALAWISSSLAATDPEVWILVDTRADLLKVMKGEKPVKTFYNIALGRGGTSRVRHRGDGKTPLGVFRVGWMNWNSPFHIFIGLDFPSWDYAVRARQRKLIDDKTYNAIMDALLSGQTPPQTTPLGGHIGIHGLGDADPAVHRVSNWTKGCIALTNEQVEQLVSWIQPGTRVVIR
jgi:murein L,D-transpeptidase YafK